METVLGTLLSVYRLINIYVTSEYTLFYFKQTYLKILSIAIYTDHKMQTNQIKFAFYVYQ